MGFPKSAVTYAIVALMVIWVLLGAITLPNANRWFRGSGQSIREDIITHNNATAETNPAGNYGNRYFLTNVYKVDNTPDVPGNGLYGPLINFGEACGNDTVSSSNSKDSIALIRQSSRCFLADKILYAQKMGAIGAIIFHNLSTYEDPSANYNGMGVPQKMVEIPAYYVDMDTGLTLAKDLQLYNRSMVRVVLLPSSQPIFGHWQFALIIVGVMLITSILAISSLQCHAWRVARQRTFDDTGNEILTADEQRQLDMEEHYWRNVIGHEPQPLISQVKRRRQRLDQAIVNLLPTRVYKDDTDKDVEMMANVSVDSFGTTCEITSCVICLESFASGDILRRLPCNHEYHRDCIDVWLTKKNGTCPLCQQFINIPAVPDEIHLEQDEYENMPDLAATWTGLSQTEHIAMRQAPWISTTTRSDSTNTDRAISNEHINANPYPPL